MNNFDIDSVLQSMVVLVDTREQPSARAEKRYQGFGVPYQRTTLNYGDYSYNAKLPDGTYIYSVEKDNKAIRPCVVIERKMSLEELSGCFTLKADIESKQLKVRNRFEKEFLRAKENGAKIYLLVENASWEKLITGKYDTKFNPTAFFASMTAWIARYNIVPIFCKQETSGKMIKEILYRELKERLERGDYDYGICEN